MEGTRTKLRRCFFASGCMVVQKLRLRASVCADWSHSSTISWSHAERETKSSVKDVAMASFRLSRTFRRRPLADVLLDDCGERLFSLPLGGEALLLAAMYHETQS